MLPEVLQRGMKWEHVLLRTGIFFCFMRPQEPLKMVMLDLPSYSNQPKPFTSHVLHYRLLRI